MWHWAQMVMWHIMDVLADLNGPDLARAPWSEINSHGTTTQALRAVREMAAAVNMQHDLKAY